MNPIHLPDRTTARSDLLSLRGNKTTPSLYIPPRSPLYEVCTSKNIKKNFSHPLPRFLRQKKLSYLHSQKSPPSLSNRSSNLRIIFVNIHSFSNLRKIFWIVSDPQAVSSPEPEYPMLFIECSWGVRICSCIRAVVQISWIRRRRGKKYSIKMFFSTLKIQILKTTW